MVLNVHRDHKAYYERGEEGEGGMEVGEEGDYIPIDLIRLRGFCVSRDYSRSWVEGKMESALES